MQQSILKKVLPILRYGLLLAAVVYLVSVVPWYDTVLLKSGARVRLVAETDAGVEVVRDGALEVLAWEQVAVERGIEQEIPQITYGIRGIFGRTDARLFVLAIVLFFPVPLLQSMRLVWMLAMQDVRMSYWNAIKLSYAGNFFNFALPGTLGGDVVKAYYITRFTHHKTEAVTTVVLDRVVGLMGLTTIATITFFIGWAQIDWDPTYRNSLAAGLAIVWGGLIVGAIVVFSGRLRHLLKLSAIGKRLPASEQVMRIGRATVAMRRHKGLVAASLGVTLVLQMFVVFAAFVMARALGMEGHFSLYFIFVPLGFLIAAIPVSPPMAIGVMEAAYVQFFCWNGLNPVSEAVAFALANRLTQLVWALPGGLVPLLGLHLPSKDELARMEAALAEPEDTAGESAPAQG